MVSEPPCRDWGVGQASGGGGGANGPPEEPCTPSVSRISSAWGRRSRGPSSLDNGTGHAAVPRPGTRRSQTQGQLRRRRSCSAVLLHLSLQSGHEPPHSRSDGGRAAGTALGRGALTVTPKPGPGPPGTGSGAPGTHGSLHPTAPSPVHAPASTALHVVLSVGPGWVPGQAGSGQPGTRTSHTTSPSACPGARAAEPAPPAPSPAAAVALRGAPSAGLPPRGSLRGFYCRDAPCPAAAPHRWVTGRLLSFPRRF